MLHVASVCTPCCVLLRVVGSCCGKFETGQTFMPLANGRNNVGLWSYEIHHGALNLQIKFEGIALKLEKVGFNPCPSLPSSPTDDRKQIQCLNIALSNKPEPLFLEFNWWEKTFKLFTEIYQSACYDSFKSTTDQGYLVSRVFSFSDPRDDPGGYFSYV